MLNRIVRDTVMHYSDNSPPRKQISEEDDKNFTGIFVVVILVLIILVFVACCCLCTGRSKNQPNGPPGRMYGPPIQPSAPPMEQHRQQYPQVQQYQVAQQYPAQPQQPYQVEPQYRQAASNPGYPVQQAYVMK